MAQPRPKSRKNSKEYEKRLRTVLRLFIRGISEEEIAHAVGVSQPTISNDLVEIAKRNQSVFDEKLEGWQEPKILAAQVHQRAEERRREFWDAASNSQGTAKVAAVRETREEDDWEIKTLQRLGLIYEEPAKGVMEDDYDELVAKIKKNRAERKSA